MKDLSNATISKETLTEVLGKLNEIKTALPFLISISPLERKRSRNLGRLSAGLGKEISQSSRTHLQAVPREFDVDYYDNRREFFDMLDILKKEFRSITQSLDDTQITTGTTIQQQSDDVYAALKRAAKRESKYQLVVDQLSTFYRKTRVKKNTDTNDTLKK